jgi:ATP adenylyltransferase
MTDQLKAKFDEAVQSGALIYYESESVRVKQGSVTYEMRYCPALAKKPPSQLTAAMAPPPTNPFLPVNPDLFIEHLTPSHNLLFNKFSVIRPHLLLTAKEFYPQDHTLTEGDFEAVSCFFDRYGGDWLCFYNCGRLSGASQPHRHFQFVPLDGMRPIRGRVVELDGTAGLYATYRELVKETPVGASFNLFINPRWMGYVQRRSDQCSLGIDLNSLGLMGRILVKTPEHLERLKEHRDLGALLNETCFE